jgi:hypothetical protein
MGRIKILEAKQVDQIIMLAAELANMKRIGEFLDLNRRAMEGEISNRKKFAELKEEIERKAMAEMAQVIQRENDEKLMATQIMMQIKAYQIATKNSFPTPEEWLVMQSRTNEGGSIENTHFGHYMQDYDKLMREKNAGERKQQEQNK